MHNQIFRVNPAVGYRYYRLRVRQALAPGRSGVIAQAIEHLKTDIYADTYEIVNINSKPPWAISISNLQTFRPAFVGVENIHNFEQWLKDTKIDRSGCRARTYLRVYSGFPSGTTKISTDQRKRAPGSCGMEKDLVS